MRTRRENSEILEYRTARRRHESVHQDQVHAGFLLASLRCKCLEAGTVLEGPCGDIDVPPRNSDEREGPGRAGGNGGRTRYLRPPPSILEESF